ncbi:MAG: hypothetical protein LC637_04355 [Xanthomonadaceae bacterium]|nr:hypothetical protein [Xanthomonadaceae bacterium]
MKRINLSRATGQRARYLFVLLLSGLALPWGVSAQIVTELEPVAWPAAWVEPQGEQYASLDHLLAAVEPDGPLPGALADFHWNRLWAHRQPASMRVLARVLQQPVAAPAHEIGARFFPSRPEILSQPPLSVRVGRRYEYQPEAFDADGDALDFSLSVAPRRMRVDKTTGLIVWRPAAPPGDHEVELTVRDPAGAQTRQTWSLRVLRPNEQLQQPPQITSQPPASATVDRAWVYQITAEDSDDDIERFELVQGPVGMRINADSGRVDWAPANVDEYPVIVAVVDAAGLRDEQSFVITVGSAPGVSPPEWQSPDSLTAPLGRTTRFQLAAADPDGDDLNYFVEPLPLPAGMRMSSLTGALEFTPSPDQVGDHQLMLAASDGRFRIYQEFTVTVPPPEGPTGLRGRVQNGPEDGLPGVRLVLGMGEDAIERFTDADGYFQFNELDLEALAGPGVLKTPLRLLVDGAATGTGETFATVPKEVHLIAGADNLLDDPIILLPLDTASADPVNPAATSAITSAPVQKGGESFAPVTLTIPPGMARWEETGELFTGEIHITDIPDNELSPQPLPPELDFSVYVAMQPFGVVYDEPIPISFPNVNKLLPGTRTEIFGLDHDTGEFVKFGDAEVSADGRTVDSIGGVVVANSWHGNVLSAAEGEGGGSDDNNQCNAACGSTVGLTDGTLTVSHATPAYQSLGQGRAVTLEYNSNNAQALPIVRFDHNNSSFSAFGPASTAARLNVGGVTFSPQFYWEGSAEAAQGAIQFDATGCPSEVYDWELELTSTVPGGFSSRRKGISPRSPRPRMASSAASATVDSRFSMPAAC